MHCYIASRFSRKNEMKNKIEELRSLGHTNASTWIYGDPEKQDGQSQEEYVEEIAKTDVEDIMACDTLIAITEESRSALTRGGRHVEFGIALGRKLKGDDVRLIVIGPLENDFYHLKDHIEHFNTWEEFMDYMTIPEDTPLEQELIEAKERIKELENIFKYVAAGLYEAMVPAYAGTMNKDVSFTLKKDKVEDWQKLVSANFQLNDDGDLEVTYTPRIKTARKRVVHAS